MGRQTIIVSSKTKKKEIEGWKEKKKKNSDHYDFEMPSMRRNFSI